jgi:dephospho-CoA kinase
MSWLLGLTGSIGMGKSTTAKMFRDEGIPVWDADAAVHRLYERGGAAVAQVGAAFPEAVLDGAISREALKKIIAADPSALGRLEKIVHPLVAQDRAAFIAANPAPIVVVDIPLLYETGAEAWLDSVIVVSVSPEAQRARVLARTGMTEAQFQAILSRQMPDEEKRRRADHLIETTTMDEARAKVRALIDELKAKADA